MPGGGQRIMRGVGRDAVALGPGVVWAARLRRASDGAVAGPRPEAPPCRARLPAGARGVKQKPQVLSSGFATVMMIPAMNPAKPRVL